MSPSPSSCSRRRAALWPVLLSFPTKLHPFPLCNPFLCPSEQIPDYFVIGSWLKLFRWRWQPLEAVTCIFYSMWGGGGLSKIKMQCKMMLHSFFKKHKLCLGWFLYLEFFMYTMWANFFHFDQSDHSHFRNKSKEFSSSWSFLGCPHLHRE